MNQKEAVAELRRLADEGGYDVERDHSQADDVLCDLLRTLGCQDVVAEWDRIKKWYA